jgi:MarR family transcriptional regulator for hemolysin
MQKIEEVIFYTLEKAIKTYRQFAQRRITRAGFDITIDQWLVLRLIAEDGERYQHEIAEAVFKDTASVTRIIDLLVQKGCLTRELHETDRRRFRLLATQAGRTLIEKVAFIVEENRATALRGLSAADTAQTQAVLQTIIKNCQSK